MDELINAIKVLSEHYKETHNLISVEVCDDGSGCICGMKNFEEEELRTFHNPEEFFEYVSTLEENAN